ncbi:MAG: protoheme IX farnesyltransferase [Phenylobacterium sp. RIFCSPHIGHO2_01_FULL_69_31]|uniref:heme o synthase n=1 Tax=Phenylobacterium sp. RIFCSPHIGHO2_01_FULL_69_31 TaxID=1801944 RepID=UPI0008D8B60B|nr:heme o synthase [Phenylobacterium sp. RIFCSPHIGHO2_01_FULL_69_31]OHB29293.1 MAG: protoheme IX farnesyltransferase [Phenylobacterium sp. RIFCSPHIGHO2_01_FULL_69_31]
MAMATAHTNPRAIARWQDFLQLLKPRVMSLVIFTALTGLVCAPDRINPILAAVAVLCIAVGAGASAALNMWYDADIDAKMRRTRGRPVPAGRVQGADALALGVVLSLFSVMLMGMAVNWFAAGLLAFTIVFYAVVYTMWLKRWTAQNIVIGGLAGALPPVIGWAAASGTAPLNAWLLCAIIFMWTPPHFWALSLYTSEDYAKAGVPMMPVVKGASSTRLQILIYSLLLIPVCVAPAFTGLGGLGYLAVSTLGGLVFLLLAWRLYRSRAGEAADPRNDDGLYDVRAGARDARNLFAFSILYLALLFATLLAEHLMGARPLELFR